MKRHRTDPECPARSQVNDHEWETDAEYLHRLGLLSPLEEAHFKIQRDEEAERIAAHSATARSPKRGREGRAQFFTVPQAAES